MKGSVNTCATVISNGRERPHVYIQGETAVVLVHADELAARFEQYEPNDSDEVDVAAVSALRAASKSGRSQSATSSRRSAKRVRQLCRGPRSGEWWVRV